MMSYSAFSMCWPNFENECEQFLPSLYALFNDYNSSVHKGNCECMREHEIKVTL